MRVNMRAKALWKFILNAEVFALLPEESSLVSEGSKEPRKDVEGNSHGAEPLRHPGVNLVAE